jgi:GTP-binding protein
LKFIDEAKIVVRSGDGGNGCLSFRREAFRPHGGPDGGDGGKGGDVLITASAKIHSLLDFHYQRLFKASKGAHGQGSDRHGKNGLDVHLLVPLGTLIREAETGLILDDLVEDGQTIVVARGGRGGKGNRHFATSTHRTPRFAQKGEPGVELTLQLELKLLAQVGLIGLPNAGKSTLLSRLSAARPKISDYPFTTLSPNLGVIEDQKGRRLTLADIPGIIAGASAGAGLGMKFLRHIERTQLLVFLIDGSLEGDGPKDSFLTLWEEMKAFNPKLVDKPGVIGVNKMDLPGSQINYKRIEAALKPFGLPIIPLSAKTGQGLPLLIAHLFSRIGSGDYGDSNGLNRSQEKPT